MEVRLALARLLHPAGLCKCVDESARRLLFQGGGGLPEAGPFDGLVLRHLGVKREASEHVQMEKPHILPLGF